MGSLIAENIENWDKQCNSNVQVNWILRCLLRCYIVVWVENYIKIQRQTLKIIIYNRINQFVFIVMIFSDILIFLFSQINQLNLIIAIISL